MKIPNGATVLTELSFAEMEKVNNREKEMSKKDAERLAEYDTFFTTFEIKDLVLVGAVITALQKGAFIKELNKVCGVRLDTDNYDCEFMLRTYDGETTVRVRDFGESWWNW